MYNICLIAQENNDHIAGIVEKDFALIGLLINDILPKHNLFKNIVFYGVKAIGSLLSGFDETVEVLFKNFF